jgi:hypothetical protein
MDGTVNGSDDDVRLRVRTVGGTWTDNSPPTLFAHTPQNYISSSDAELVFLGHDSHIEFGYQAQPDGPGTAWQPYATLDPRNATNTTAGAPGLDGSASVRFDPLRDPAPGIVDVLFYDENDGTAGYPHHATVFYKAIAIE